MKETGWRGGWKSPLCSPLAFPPFLKNILPSELPWGERGLPFHAEQGVVQGGYLGAFSSSYSHLFLSFLSIFPLVFVSLIGLTDHSSLTYSPWGRLRSLGINTVESRGAGAQSQSSKLICLQRDDERK